MAIDSIEFNEYSKGVSGYKPLTLEDIGRYEEEYQNLLPLIPAAAVIGGSVVGGKKDRREKARVEARIRASHEAQRKEYEEKSRVQSIDVSNKSCEELDNMLVDVMKKLADEYNLNESQKNAFNGQKKTIEDKIKEQKCAEERQKIATLKIQEAEQQLAKVEADKKAKQKKMLTYAGIGVGGLIATIIIIKILRG